MEINTRKGKIEVMTGKGTGEKNRMERGEKEEKKYWRYGGGKGSWR